MIPEFPGNLLFLFTSPCLKTNDLGGTCLAGNGKIPETRSSSCSLIAFHNSHQCLNNTFPRILGHSGSPLDLNTSLLHYPARNILYPAKDMGL